MKFKIFTILILIILVGSSTNVHGAPSGDDGAPPPSGGGGGGGGGPQYYNYYIPLVFDETHTDGISEITIWLMQPSAVITSFAQDKSGTSVSQYQTPVKLTFNPKDNEGLTNGSVISTTAPALVVGQRLSQDIIEDKSFAYSILSDRMMGFEFIAPEDGYFNFLSSSSNVQINIDNPNVEAVLTETIAIPFTTVEIKVDKGTYINSTGPMNGAFISYKDGRSASMAVPDYLKGDNYIFDSEITSLRVDEIDQSSISIIPEEPTELLFIFKDGSTKKVNLFTAAEFVLDNNIRGINSSRGKIDVSLKIKIKYGGTVRSSLIQLFAASEMRAAEIYASPNTFSTNYAITSVQNALEPLYLDLSDPNNQGYFKSTKYKITKLKYETLSVINNDEFQIMYSEDALYSYVSSPGLIENPMAPSASFNNIPLNTQAAKNVSGLASTWYRSANIAVGKIEIVPGPIEEYTGQQLRIEIYSNGSLPASKFKIRIVIDDEDPIEETFDFIAVNETLVFKFDRFIQLGSTKMNVTVEVDIDDEVNELNEDDNYMEGNYNIDRNIRLRFSGYLSLSIVFVYILYRSREWQKKQKKMSRTHVDVLITEEVIE